MELLGENEALHTVTQREKDFKQKRQFRNIYFKQF